MLAILIRIPGYAAICVVLVLVLSPLTPSAAPWLMVSDIHLNPVSRDAAPSMLDDTNGALFRSGLAAMKAVDPNPPVVFITGDFFAHHFAYGSAKATMGHIAAAFRSAFPRAQFVIALGNEDSGCGDYRLAPRAAFLRETADAWAPLVNGHGEAPDFVRSFSENGSYLTHLPTGISAFVTDDVFWSPRYRAGCMQPDSGSDGTFESLARALPPDGGRRRWVIAHIPPGIDAFSTVWLAHGLLVVPFLRSAEQARLVQLLSDERRGIALLLDAHTHKFSYRLVGLGGRHPVPALLVPALSPIFANDPSFLTVDVGPDGTIRDAREHSYVAQNWHEVGGLGSLGLHAFTAGELTALQARLANEPRLRATFASLYDGAAADSEIGEGDWRSYWCAATELEPAGYRACLRVGGIGLLTTRGVLVVGAAGLLLAALLAGIILIVLRYRSAPAMRGRRA